MILVYLGGGLSHHDSFDPKPNAPAEVRGKYATIATRSPGVRYGELMPRLAARSDRFSLVRSGCHGNDHHETATNWVLSGKFGSAFGDYPAIGAVVAHELGYNGPLPPVFLGAPEPVVHLGAGQERVSGGPVRVIQDRRPERPQFPGPGHQP